MSETRTESVALMATSVASGIEGIIMRPTFLRQVVPFYFNSEDFQSLVTIICSTRAARRNMWVFDYRPVADALPHFESLLFRTPAGHLTDAPTIAAWRLDQRLLEMRRGWGAGVDWLLASNPEVVVRLGRVELAVFTTGIGFITLEYRVPKGRPDQPVGAWLDFFRASRYLTDRTAIVFTLSSDSNGVTGRPEQIGGTVGDHTFSAADLVRSLLPDCEAIEALVGPRGARAFPFAGLFAQGVPEASRIELVMRLQRHIRSTSDYNPDPDGAPHPPWFMRRDESVWHFASMSSVGCIVFDAPKMSYLNITLPDELRQYYHLLLLMALQQRLRLLVLDKASARSWKEPDLQRRFEEFARLRSELVDLTSRGFLQQPSDKYWIDQFYSGLRDVFQVHLLKESAEDRVREIHDLALVALNDQLRTQSDRILKVEAQRRKEERDRVKRADELEERRRRAEEERERLLVSRLSLLAAVIAIPALTLTFLGINIKGVTSGDGVAAWLAAVCATVAIAAGISVAMAIRFVTRRRHRDGDDGSVRNR